MVEEVRKTDIDVIGNAPWGTHFCLFYQTKEDLIDILVPYFKAGLENNEFCMWVTSEPLNVEDARGALQRVVEDLDDYIEKEQIEILDYSQWYTRSGGFDADEVLQGWVEKEAQAVRRGFDGLRLTGNTFWLEEEDWRGFTEYEAAIDRVIGQYRMLALCTYSLDRCGASEVIDVVSNHQFALIRREGEWQIIESAERKRAEEALWERVKELTCLYAVSGDMQEDLSVEGLCRRVVEHLIPAMRFPEITVPVIELDGRRFTSEKYTEGLSHGLQAEIKVGGEARGQVWVYYAQERPFLIPEEQNLVNAIAGALGRWLERKQAEEALREGEQRYRLFLESISDSVYVLDREWRHVVVNDAATHFVQIPREKLLGGKLTDLFPGIEETAFFKTFQWVMDTRKPNTVAEEYTFADGRKGWYEVHVYPVPEGILCISRDITEHKRAEEALRASEERYRAVVEDQMELICRFSLDGTLTFVNEAYCRYFGKRPEELIGHSCMPLIPEEDREIVRQQFRSLSLENPVMTYEHRVVTPSGEIHWQQWSDRAIWDEQGHIIEFQSVGRDITERKRAEEELRQSYAELQRALEGTIHALGSAIELRDPYTAGHQRRISQLACAIANELGLPQEQIEGLRMAALIHDLGKMTVPAEILNKPVELNDLEWGMIQAHPQIGHNIFKDMDFPWPLADIVLQHHERLDGSGYPQGLSGEEIMLEARILAVADVVEAMSSHRPYRPAHSIDEALEEISQNRGRLYDPEAVDACLKLFSEDGFTFE